jgi:hypothetical protein
MITNHDAALIMRKDFDEMSESDANANLFQYYVGINSWVLLTKAHNPIGADILEDAIRHSGLIAIIRRGAQFAEAIVADAHCDDSLFSVICAGLNVPDALQVCRFLKRFTVISNTLKEKALTDFLNTNQRIAGINRRNWRNSMILQLIRDEFDWIVSDYNAELTNLTVTSGTSYHGYNNFCSKLLYEYDRPNFYGSPLYPAVGNAMVSPGGLASKHARITQVPKSYKTYRTIAMETVCNQSDQQAIRAGLEHALEKVAKQAPIHNQLINGTHAATSCTIDLSAASDSVSWWLLGSICSNQRLLSDIRDARSFFGHYGSENSTVLHMVATMGNGFCFALETAIFLAVARAAYTQSCLFLGITPNYDEDVHAYGDDIEVPDFAYETTIEFLTYCGFIVNQEKSFDGEANFHESCGMDWYDGHYVTSTYWPRAAVSRNIDGAVHLLSLEGRLYERGRGLFYWDCTRFLCNQVKQLADVSTVDIDDFLEYDLQDKCLVGPISDIKTIVYSRDYGIQPGDGKSYSEERKYAKLVKPTYVSVPVAWNNSVTAEFLDTALYASFLHDGPRFNSGLDALLNISAPYHDKAISRSRDSFVVSSTRLI